MTQRLKNGMILTMGLWGDIKNHDFMGWIDKPPYMVHVLSTAIRTASPMAISKMDLSDQPLNFTEMHLIARISRILLTSVTH